MFTVMCERRMDGSEQGHKTKPAFFCRLTLKETYLELQKDRVAAFSYKVQNKNRNMSSVCLMELFKVQTESLEIIS